MKQALKGLIKLPNTVSEAPFGTLKKVILKKVRFQNYFHKKIYIFSKFLSRKFIFLIDSSSDSSEE